jgi:uncharacterized BrkB/YihY/UPF0761 family membrane protein
MAALDGGNPDSFMATPCPREVRLINVNSKMVNRVVFIVMIFWLIAFWKDGSLRKWRRSMPGALCSLAGSYSSAAGVSSVPLRLPVSSALFS